MRLPFICRPFAFILLSFSLVSVAVGQYQERALERARSVRMLTDDREGVRKIFHDFNLNDSTETRDEFSFGETEVEVTYSSGECDEIEDEIWDVPAGRAVEITITDSSGLRPDILKVDLSKLEKEQIYPEREAFFIRHSKAGGFAIKLDDEKGEEVLTSLILFPSTRSKAKTSKTKFAKEFVGLKSWFGSRKLEDRVICVHVNQNANVTALEISPSEVGGTTAGQVNVAATAVDPENDILTYVYTVTGGRIIGTGAKVKWDLTGVRPGTYSIAVGVDDGAGVVGQTMTKTVVVR